MNLQDYIAKRAAFDSTFRAARQELQSAFAFRRTLIRARTVAGVSQHELANRIGTKRSIISQLENGDAESSVAMLRRLAGELNVNVDISSA